MEPPSVLRAPAQVLRQNRRLENSLNMANTRTSSKKKKAPAQNVASLPLNSADGAPENAPNADLLQQLALLQQKAASLEQENSALKTTHVRPSKRNGKRAIFGKIPAKYNYEVISYVETELWRNTKFIATNKELADVAKAIMADMPEFQAFVAEDAEDTKDNIEQFVAIYRGVINKTINQKRTNVAGNLKKAYEKRYLEGKAMPNHLELKAVIYRQDLEEVEVPDNLSEKDTEELELANERVRRNQEFFDWYWTCLLPTVGGRHNWGHNIRNYNTINQGIMPGTQDKKYITSSDEALILILYMNCSRRFPYTAQCAKNNVEVDKFSPQYQTRWCSSKAGQREFGGWDEAGRVQYGKFRNKIVCAKRKERVDRVEKMALQRIQAANNTKMGDGDKKPAATEEFEGKPEVMVSFIGLNSEDEQEISEDEMDFEDVFQEPPVKKAKV